MQRELLAPRVVIRPAPSTSLVPATMRGPIAAHALLVGVGADALLSGVGPGYSIWMMLIAASLVAITWRGGKPVRRSAAIWMLGAILIALCIAVRGSEELVFVNVLASLAAMALAAAAQGGDVGAHAIARVRDLMWSMVAAVRESLVGAVPLLDSPANGGSPVRKRVSRFAPLLRASVAGLLVLVLFGTMLRGADPLFASLVDLPRLDFANALRHAVFVLLGAWFACGLLRTATTGEELQRAPDRFAVEFGSLEVAAALTALLIVFSAYVLSQLGLLFGGAEFLKAHTGLTVANYARSGFFELIWIVMLVLPVLIACAAFVRDAVVPRRQAALSLGIIALLLATLGSAAVRMKLYVHYYGLTSDRLYPLVFMTWLGLVLVWFAMTTLSGRPRRFVFGAEVAGGVMLLALNISNPDLIIARANVGRAFAKIPQTDVWYLSRLSGSATELAIGELLHPNGADLPRCMAAGSLLGQWGPNSEAATDRGMWRRTSLDERKSIASVERNFAAVARVQAQACKVAYAKH